jgi:hypothetical protein
MKLRLLFLLNQARLVDGLTITAGRGYTVLLDRRSLHGHAEMEWKMRILNILFSHVVFPDRFL